MTETSRTPFAPRRPASEVLREFPADRVLWARTPRDEVVVVHRGEVTVYDSPEAFADAMVSAQARQRQADLDALAADFRATIADLEAQADAMRRRLDRAEAPRWRRILVALFGKGPRP